jgi:hypothetical protein
MQVSRAQQLKNWWRRSLYGYSVAEQDPLINAAYRRYGIRPSARKVPAKWWGNAILSIAAKKKYIAAILGAFLVVLGLIKDWIPAIPERSDKITREWLGWASREPTEKDHSITPKK